MIVYSHVRDIAKEALRKIDTPEARAALGPSADGVKYYRGISRAEQ